MAKKILPPRQGFMDEAVEGAFGDHAIFGDLKKKSKAIIMTPAQAREQERQRSRSRQIFDLPRSLVQALDICAENEGVPKSQLVAYMLTTGLKSYVEGKVAFVKEPSKSPKFSFNLQINEPPEIKPKK
jgi:hypothetical protein